MPETITLNALDLSGETLTMFLRKSDGTLLNTGGDTMTEAGSTGVFAATLAEARTGLGPLAVRACAGAETADNLLYDGFLVEGSAVIDSTVTAVLDSATRVKLDPVQPDYAPAKAGEAMALTVAYDAAKTAAAQTSVDDLPTNTELTAALSGKATTSDVTTVGTAVAAVSTKLGTPAGASVSADVASIKTDTGTTIPGLFTTLTTKVRKFFQLGYRKDAAIATDNAAELVEINTNGGTGAGAYQPTTDSLQSIRDNLGGAGGGNGTESALMLSTTIATVTSQTVLVLTEGTAGNDAYNGLLVVITDAATATQKAKAIVLDYAGSTKTLTLTAAPTFTVAAGDAIAIIAVGSSGSSAVTLTLGAAIPLQLGEVTGLEEPLVIGDDYTEEVGRRIPITLTDINGAAVAVTYGSHSLAADCSITMLFQPGSWTRNNKTTKTSFTGTCTFVAASGATPAYLWLTLPRTETAKAIPDDYQTHVEARWSDGFNVTLAYKGTAKFTRDIQRVS